MMDIPSHKNITWFWLSTDHSVESQECTPAFSMGWPHNANDEQVEQADMIVKIEIGFDEELGGITWKWN